MNINNLHDVRAALCRRLEELDDTSKPVDLVRARATVEVSEAIVSTVKVELTLTALLKGAMELPFVELPERESPPAPRVSEDLPSPHMLVPPTGASGSARRKDPLESGPAMNHPWRTSVHRMRR